MNIAELVDSYIKLRDKKSEMKKAYEVSVEGVDSLMAKIEGQILAHFQETGQESAGTASGTAYKSTRASATVADRDGFLAYLQQSENWQLLDARVSKKAVDEFVAENKELPPGVSLRSEVTINIRRA